MLLGVELVKREHPVRWRVLLAGFLWLAATCVRVFAASAGIVSGTVTDDRTHAPVSGVKVEARSPSATYHAVTDASGHYRFLGMIPDDYVLSFTSTTYAPYSTSLVVLNGSQQTINVPLSKTLKTIASTRARSSGSAFQRGMTIDTYTVTGSQINTVQGKSFNTNENQLLAQHSQRDHR